MQQVKRISRRLKRVEIVLMVAAALVLMSGALALQTQDQLADKVVRLHVLANSDSAEDQALKLRVRDSVLAAGAEIFGNAGSLAEAEALARENIWVLYAAAERTLREEGSSYPVSFAVPPARRGVEILE